ncbi:hypothetical protein AYJ57_15225 [Salipiger sp. CCB-MM3]|uniref:hypothetical protein n=1 Tax=Salipiger sp. CCB-MM3 TaxID=1792508 RepID=UPI00080AAFA8|nr:hypothetical protein [Salipiger sp. CCB-MM3]ANT61818.1 hypothetical protein AYJ57_15225 [Salipiger sp. CCB-MM3]
MSPEKMKDFLDDFALLPERHRIEVVFHCGRLAYIPMRDDFEGYEAFATKPFGGGELWAEGSCKGTDYVASVDPEKISNHERLKIISRNK